MTIQAEVVKVETYPAARHQIDLGAKIAYVITSGDTPNTKTIWVNCATTEIAKAIARKFKACTPNANATVTTFSILNYQVETLQEKLEELIK